MHSLKNENNITHSTLNIKAIKKETSEIIEPSS